MKEGFQREMGSKDPERGVQLQRGRERDREKSKALH